MKHALSVPVLTERQTELFWAKVDKAGDCWTWLGAITELGYGRVKLGRLAYRAHRVSYSIAFGDIGPGLVVDHTCHNPACVRPSHLRAVTDKQNNENRATSSEASNSGLRGVSYRAGMQKWGVASKHQGEYHWGGWFTDLEEAAQAARALRSGLHTHNDLDRV